MARRTRGERRMSKIVIDGKEIDVPAEYTLLQACEAAGAEDSALLLPRAAVDRRQLPDVPRRSEGRPAQADGVLRHGGERSAPRPERRAAGRLDQFADGAQGAQGRDGVPADQPSARLPDLRSGRRMRSAGSGDGLWRRLVPLRREQARRRRQIYRRAGQDLDEPLHPMHALRALRDRSRGRSRTRRDRPRRGHGDHLLSRARAELASCRATSSISVRSAP